MAAWLIAVRVRMLELQYDIHVATQPPNMFLAVEEVDTTIVMRY